MIRTLNNRMRLFGVLAAVLAIGAFQFGGINLDKTAAQKGAAPEVTSTPQPVPYSLNWTTGSVTANDDWSTLPGVVGFLGDYDAAAPTAVDPRALLTPFVTNNIDVIADQSNVALTNGGVGDFDGIPDLTVAVQGSGTADAPHIIIYLNTTGFSNIHVGLNVRDIDSTADNAVQQVDVQYRVGGAGNYASVSGGYIADASDGPSLTKLTPLSLTLPAAANNQSQVEVRFITTNAIGSDEWIGFDDIVITGSPAAPLQHVIDFNGDGKTDWNVIRNTGGGPGGQLTWFTQYNGLAGGQTNAWGLNGDEFTPGDFDGDNSTDVAIWRPQPGLNSAFYILQSTTGTLRTENFGLSTDDPSVIGDYNNDGKDDIAVYRGGAAAGNPSFWYWRTVLNGPVSNVQWGQNGDFPAPGDYDGDGSSDFVVQRNAGGGQARFWIRLATGAISSTVFGTPTDVLLPGDYDGDGKTDLATVRGSGGQILWSILPSGGGPYTSTFFGNSATDFPTQGDYDGDGKTDIAVWRPDVNPTNNLFYVNKSTGGLQTFEWGQNGDYPVANYNNH